jgi:hypothetical protein
MSNQSPEFPANVPRFEFVPGTTIREAYAGRAEDYRPDEAPPLIAARDNEEISAHQQDVVRMLGEILDAKNFRPGIRELIETRILSNEALTDIDNQKGYTQRLVLLPELELDEETFALHDKVLMGKGSLRENYDHMRLLGRSGAELSTLRTIGGHRGEYQEMIADDVKELMGEDYSDEDPYKIKVVGFDNGFYTNGQMRAFILSYKRHFGQLPDGADVKSRTSLIVQADFASGFDQEIKGVIEASAQHKLEHIPRLKRVRPVLDDIIEQGPNHPNVVASMCSIYANNERTLERIKQRDEKAVKNRSPLGQKAFDSFAMHYRD